MPLVGKNGIFLAWKSVTIADFLANNADVRKIKVVMVLTYIFSLCFSTFPPINTLRFYHNPN